jgi:hypothetical protein
MTDKTRADLVLVAPAPTLQTVETALLDSPAEEVTPATDADHRSSSMSGHTFTKVTVETPSTTVEFIKRSEERIAMHNASRAEGLIVIRELRQISDRRFCS